MLSYYIIIGITITIAVAFLIIFIPFLVLMKKKTKKVVDKSYTKFIELNKLIITVTSGTIAITASFIQKDISSGILIYSWICLAICLFSSVLVLLLDYIEEYTFGIFEKTMNDLRQETENENEKNNSSKVVKDLTRTAFRIYMLDQLIIVK